jgi:hypothetical protein
MIKKINWHPDATDLRKFGLMLMLGLGVMGSVFYFLLEKQPFAIGLWGFGIIGGLSALTGSFIGKPFYYIWTGFGYLMSTAISFLVFSFVYFVVMAPMAVTARVCGRDRLKLNRMKVDTYWVDAAEYPDAKEYYEEQF